MGMARGTEFAILFSMGYRDEDGEFQYQPGFGNGVEGTEYNAERAQGHFGPMTSAQYSPRFAGGLPGWAKDKDSRAHTLLVFFERRANKSVKIPPGDFSTRLQAVTAQLETARQVELWRLYCQLEYAYNRRAFDRQKFLEKQGEFTAWATAVLTDYFFDAADCPGEVTQSWDAGQCAYRHGEVDKIFVKQLVKKVDDIGLELYPDGRQRCTLCGEPFLPARTTEKYCLRRLCASAKRAARRSFKR
jgi:hypothetical protein